MLYDGYAYNEHCCYNLMTSVDVEEQQIFNDSITYAQPKCSYAFQPQKLNIVWHGILLAWLACGLFIANMLPKPRHFD